ncbi:MAG TPA: DNA methyltransferase [Candidatus Hydrogenedens sp.]|nr:DNA methyltransferase [Candidatus Hydrogenedens sp.]
MKKPELNLQTTTLWDYPSQHYGERMQGDQNYPGATPSYVIWNLLQRYTHEKDLIIDPMCGSGTTIDVCKDLNRKVIGFDLSPYRNDIIPADARHLPLRNECTDFVFVDPPYGNHIHYSDDPRCIGLFNANDEAYYQSMEACILEIYRILKPQRFAALYCCDSFQKKKPFAPIGFRLFSIMLKWFVPIDIISVVRHNRTLKRRHYHTEAIRGNYFIRGFNYLFIMKKESTKNKNK